MAWLQNGKWRGWVRNVAGVNEKVWLGEAQTKEEAEQLEKALRFKARKTRDGLDILCPNCKALQAENDKLLSVIDATLDMRAFPEHFAVASKAETIAALFESSQFDRRPIRTKRDDAQDWLKRILVKGPLYTKDIIAAGKTAGFHVRTIARARVALRVVAVRHKGRGRWSLPRSAA